MYNYTNTAIALLVRMHLLTEEAGQYLSKELENKIHSARYNDAYELVDEVLKELEAKSEHVLVEPWMSYVRKLEQKLETVRSEAFAANNALSTRLDTLDPKSATFTGNAVASTAASGTVNVAPTSAAPTPADLGLVNPPAPEQPATPEATDVPAQPETPVVPPADVPAQPEQPTETATTGGSFSGMDTFPTAETPAAPIDTQDAPGSTDPAPTAAAPTMPVDNQPVPASDGSIGSNSGGAIVG